ncbi:acetylglutamate kinase [Aestuariibacter halophilus]|uniref:Acetylglutamate kinase n=1 Tax=Fluctibacter halophilus TaxID=226011 RepID=A0ABS8G9W5_9ALTE|nr:acetylglutamate kinase [Aestuariibacter halophilus]MCC2617369.1 acetylglutamate kinase [Aestuariibacter halophilus]
MSTSALVVKVGGALIDAPTSAKALLQALNTLQQQRPVVLVHGGGAGVERLLSQLGLSSHKHQGLRVTPDDQIDYVVGALAGTANKQLCALAISVGVTPVGLSLADGGLVNCRVLDPALGHVGKASPGNPDLLQRCCADGFLPVVSSIGADPEGNLLNVNADQAATAIAATLAADLLLLSDVPGVLDGNKQLIKHLEQQDVETLINDNIITDGMIVKVRAAQQAATALGRPVCIASWQQTDALLALSEDHFPGTLIAPVVARNTHET